MSHVRREPPLVLLLMGVSGAGKSTIGNALARRTGWPFRDADSFHPPENIAKMRRGAPLSDTDRMPWLAAIAAWIDGRRLARAPAIVSCSALKRAYREQLIGARSDVTLVFLAGDRALIGSRLEARTDHFMPKALLDSQFAALEAPEPDEKALVVDIRGSPEAVAGSIAAALRLPPAA